MATLKVIGTGSRGNAYVLTCGGQHLFIEAGLPAKHILSAIDFKVGNVIACLVSHSHGDHFGYSEQLKRYRIPILGPCTNPKLEPKHRYKLGAFEVVPLSVPHGDCECYAYVIDHEDCGRIVFATDLSDFPYIIPDVNHILIEANYSEKVLFDVVMDGEEVQSSSERHLEIDKCVEIVKRHDNAFLNNVVLLHLSDQLSNALQFKDNIQTEYAQIFVAERGMEIILNKDVF